MMPCNGRRYGDHVRRFGPDCDSFFLSGKLLGIEPVETSHELAVGSKTLKYTARAGVIPLKDQFDETEAEIYLTRLQEEFDEKIKSKLGDKYLPGNNDPDTLNSK